MHVEWWWARWKGSAEKRARQNQTPERRWYFQNSLLLSPTILIREASLCVLDPYTVRPSQHTFQAINTFIKRSHFFSFFWQRPAASGSRGDSLMFASQLNCVRLGGIMLSLPLRSWDKIIAANGIRELLMRGREPLENTYLHERGTVVQQLICRRKADSTTPW